jgi:hypothetical protein
MARLAPMVASDEKLASKMPQLFVTLIRQLKEKSDGKPV